MTGLWQVADMERGGSLLDLEIASSALLDYARAGFDSFDMADHYGSAELIAGRFLARAAGGEPTAASRPAVFTKWCPTPGPMTREVVRAGVERSLQRLGVQTIDLLQFHWWSFEHPAYLDAMKVSRNCAPRDSYGISASPISTRRTCGCSSAMEYRWRPIRCVSRCSTAAPPVK